MSNSVYKINKGINRPIEFKGLKAQYIWYLGAGILALVILFAILYISGVNAYICLAFILGCGTVLFIQVYRISNKYGEHGLMKKIAGKRIPKVLKCYSREIFRKQKKTTI